MEAYFMQMGQYLDVNGPDYLNLAQEQDLMMLQEEQNELMRDEYSSANADSVRNTGHHHSVREQLMELYLHYDTEIKRMTSFPAEVFQDILQTTVNGESVATMIERLLAEKGVNDYQATWALMETMHYLVSGSTYKQTANMFLTGQFRESLVIQITMRALAHQLTLPTVSCIYFVQTRNHNSIVCSFN